MIFFKKKENNMTREDYEKLDARIDTLSSEVATLGASFGKIFESVGYLLKAIGSMREWMAAAEKTFDALDRKIDQKGPRPAPGKDPGYDN